MNLLRWVSLHLKTNYYHLRFSFLEVHNSLPQRHVHLESMNVALFAKRDFADILKLKRLSCIGVGSTSNDKLHCKGKEGEKTHRDMRGAGGGSDEEGGGEDRGAMSLQDKGYQGLPTDSRS